jgi:methyltransferase (TIGR00027 family)
MALSAFLTAAYRALESERADALFRDAYAARLAGDRGRSLVATLPRGGEAAGSVAVRTHVLDQRIVAAAARQGIDTVLNLGAGLCTRAYRLPLPASLRWVDVDRAEILAHKAEVLGDARPRCQHEDAVLDLADAGARRALFRKVGEAARRALVVTEGVLIYLTPDEVAALAGDLHAEPSFERWLTDLASPTLVAELDRLWGAALSADGARMQFGPAEGGRYFARHGFRVAEQCALWDELRRFGRASPSDLRRRVHGGEAPPALVNALRAMSSVLLLERASLDR